MAVTLVDRVKIVVMSSGTGPFELGAAVPAFRGVEALTDGADYSYAVEYNSQYEAGVGTYVAGTGSFTRTPQISSNGGATVAFPANVQLVFTALAVDYGSAAGAEAGAAAGTIAGAAAGTAAAGAVFNNILNGTSAWSLPDEADGDTIPTPGSGRPYLSAGVMKIA